MSVVQNDTLARHPVCVHKFNFFFTGVLTNLARCFLFGLPPEYEYGPAVTLLLPPAPATPTQFANFTRRKLSPVHCQSARPTAPSGPDAVLPVQRRTPLAMRHKLFE